MSSWLDLPEGEGVSEREGRYITIHITYLVVSCLLPFFCPSRRSVPISVLPLGLSHPTSDLAAGQQASRARTTGSGNARPISIASSTDANGFHARTWLPARRPTPLPVCARLPPELGFRRRYAIFVIAAWWHELLDELPTRGLLQAWRYLEGFSLTH